MRYLIDYPESVKEYVRHPAPEVKRSIHGALDELSKNPRAGSPLMDELKGYWRYAARHYRIIYRVVWEKKKVLIMLIDERESVYEKLRKMLGE